MVPEAVGVHAGGRDQLPPARPDAGHRPPLLRRAQHPGDPAEELRPRPPVTIVPLYFLFGVAKILGFLLTRRFSDAWLTVRAWIWNVLHLFETRRLRQQVQQQRRRSDDEVKEHFGRVAPRVRAYAEAIADWIAGGDVAPAATEETTAREPETATAKLGKLVRQRPVLLVGAILTVLVLAGAVPLLASGTLRGGELAPWPASSAGVPR